MEKIARICWNTNNWKRPSGLKGKSKAISTYEKDKGFGHEEWLLDETKTLPDGYNYGFLQPMSVKSRKHDNQVYDIHLFTIDPNGNRLYVGCLKNAIGVTEEESKRVYQYYEKQGWIEEMMDDLHSVGCKRHKFNPRTAFNVKFKFIEATIYYSNKPVLNPDMIAPRYRLMNKENRIHFIKDSRGCTQTIDTSQSKRTIAAQEILIDPIHKKIQSGLYKILRKQYKRISIECSLDGYGRQRVDILGQHKDTNEWHFFEVKTHSARQSIREAIGQLLEYAHYPSDNRADKLFIVGPQPPDEQDKAYIKMLRDTYGLPIWFRWYSINGQKLHDSN